MQTKKQNSSFYQKNVIYDLLQQLCSVKLLKVPISAVVNLILWQLKWALQYINCLHWFMLLFLLILLRATALLKHILYVIIDLQPKTLLSLLSICSFLLPYELDVIAQHFFLITISPLSTIPLIIASSFLSEQHGFTSSGILSFLSDNPFLIHCATFTSFESFDASSLIFLNQILLLQNFHLPYVLELLFFLLICHLLLLSGVHLI